MPPSILPGKLEKATAPHNQQIRSDFLFESVVCDLHLAALTVGTFAMALTALKAGMQWSLKSSRRLLEDEGCVMQLTLRFHSEMGMALISASRVSDFYAGFGAAKSSSVALAKSPSGSEDLARAAEEWRRLCRGALGALDASSDSYRRLPAPYAHDSKLLKAFLEDAAKGDTRRVKAGGEMELPQLSQRRRSPRAVVKHTCVLHLPGASFEAEIEEVSRDGLGVRCRHALSACAEIAVEFSGGRTMLAVVARRVGQQTALRLLNALSANDPLFGQQER